MVQMETKKILEFKAAPEDRKELVRRDKLSKIEIIRGLKALSKEDKIEVLKTADINMSEIMPEDKVDILHNMFYLNEYGYNTIDLCKLDFKKYNCDVDISGMGVRGYLYQSGHNVEGHLIQGYHKVVGELEQDNQDVDGKFQTQTLGDNEGYEFEIFSDGEKLTYIVKREDAVTEEEIKGETE